MERRQDPHIRTGRRPRSGAGRAPALLCGALLASCGGSPAAEGTPPPTPLQMGGAIQGVPLALAGSVSTLAGAALGAGGGPRQANFDHPVRVVADDSYAYVADQRGHTIRRIWGDPDLGPQTETIAGQYGRPGSLDGPGDTALFDTPVGLALDGAGSLFVADSGNHAIRRIDLTTLQVATFAGTPGSFGSDDGPVSVGRMNSPWGLAFLGGTLYVVDSGNNTIRSVSAAGVLATVAGAPGSSGSADGTGAAARFAEPGGIAAATPDANWSVPMLYVADTGNHTLRILDPATGAVSTVAGVADSPGFVDGVASGRLNYPSDVVHDPATARVYVADADNHAIRYYAGPFDGLLTLAGDGTPGSTDRAAAGGPTPRFRSPGGIAFSGGLLFVADTENFTLRYLDPATGVSATLAGLPNSADGIGSRGRFYAPAHLATDGTRLYVADPQNHVIRQVVIATGAVSTIAGTPGVPGSQDGTGGGATFARPMGVTTDGQSLYVADASNCTIRRVVIATGAVSTLAGTPGVAGYADGTGRAAQFAVPFALTTDGTSLFVVDAAAFTIRRVAIATGQVTTLAGSPGVPGTADGTGAAARFDNPLGITTDGGTLYVAERSAHTIRAVTIAAGVVRTLAGAAGQPGRADGAAADARFFAPVGITTDGQSLYVAELVNQGVRRVSIRTGAVTTLAGGPSTVPGMADGSPGSFRNPFGVTSTDRRVFVADYGNATIREIR